MKIYIRATGSISPQNTFGHPALLNPLTESIGDKMNCIEPDYKDLIDPKLIRRMSRIIKMGVAAASECLQEADTQTPDAIITGTAYGCLEDSVSFLSKMVEFNEQFLTPTSFIQSTHNTVGAQIALMMKCHAYNNTFVHRGFSFESALLDAVLLMKENEANNVLVGGIDEITTASHTILTRMGLYRRTPVSNLQLFSGKHKGTIAGEGAAFFMLSNRAHEQNYASIDGFTTFYKPNGIADIEAEIVSFLKSHELAIDDVDVCILGRNGDEKSDTVYTELQSSIFNDSFSINYKNLCGEYPTAVSFALWLAANILKKGALPSAIGQKENVTRVLIYNHHQGIHHSLMLLSTAG